MKCLWHLIFSGHKWELKGQTYCAPDLAIVAWASQAVFQPEKEHLVIKAQWGWSTCLLTCSCGIVKKVEMIGNAKSERER